VPVRAEVLALSAFSARADCDELYDWATATTRPRACYVTHGEQRAAHGLAARLHAEADWLAVVPKEGERVLL